MKITQRLPIEHYQPVTHTRHEVIPFPSDVLFDFDKALIKPDGELALWGLVGEIQKKRPLRIVIEGHTDGLGQAAYNKVLSKERADAVARWLIFRRIVRASDISTVGLGHRFPAFPDQLDGKDNPDGRTRNRRIEARFLYN